MVFLWRSLVFVLLVSRAGARFVQFEIEIDGTTVSVEVSNEADLLEQAASIVRALPPGSTGGGCAGGDPVCLVRLVSQAMQARLQDMEFNHTCRAALTSHVFDASLPRTGTTGFYCSMRSIMRAWHLHFDHSSRWEDMHRIMLSGGALTSDHTANPWASLPPGSYGDVPVPSLACWLANAYPGAIIVLRSRPLDEWVRSFWWLFCHKVRKYCFEKVADRRIMRALAYGDLFHQLCAFPDTATCLASVDKVRPQLAAFHNDHMVRVAQCVSRSSATLLSYNLNTTEDERRLVFEALHCAWEGRPPPRFLGKHCQEQYPNAHFRAGDFINSDRLSSLQQGLRSGESGESPFSSAASK